MGIYQFIQQILVGLKSSQELKDITFLSAFPPSKKPVPIKKATAVLGGEEIYVSEGAFGGIYDNGKGKDAAVSLSLTVYVPYKYGGEECTKIFCRICEAAFLSENLPVATFKSSGVSANRDADAFVLKGIMTFKGELVKEDENE